MNWKLNEWQKGRVKSSTTVSQHHSAPEDLLPPLTCPLPDEPCPWGPSVTPATTPARAPGQHPGGVRLRVWLLLHPALPLSYIWLACTWNTKRLPQKTACSLWWLMCWDHSVDLDEHTHREGAVLHTDHDLLSAWYLSLNCIFRGWS